jgi:hypothetical protein
VTKFRIVRSVCQLALVLIALTGALAYVFTCDIHDPHTSGTRLFALAWLLSSLGIVVTAVVTCYSVYSKAFGTSEESKEQAELIIYTLFCSLVLAAGAGFLAGRQPSWVSNNQFDGPLCWSIALGLMGGVVSGFACFIPMLPESKSEHTQ